MYMYIGTYLYVYIYTYVTPRTNLHHFLGIAQPAHGDKGLEERIRPRGFEAFHPEPHQEPRSLATETLEPAIKHNETIINTYYYKL